MSRVATCPKCTQPVTVPEGLEPSATVRCPTCEAEYALAEVPAETAEAEASGGDAVDFLRSLEVRAYGEAGSAAPPELVPVAAIVSESDSSPEIESGEGVDDLTVEEDLPSPEGGDITVESDEEIETREPPEVWDDGMASGEPAGEPPPPFEPAPVAEAPPPSESEPSAEALPEGEEQSPEAAPAGEEAEGPAPGPEESAPEAAAPEAEAPPLDLDPLVRGPHAEQEFHLSELIVAATGEALGAAAASLIVRQNLLRPVSEEEAQAAEAAEPEAASEGFDFSALAVRDEEEVAEGEAEGRPVPARPRRRRKEKNPVKEFFGIVVGGALGLLIGYYLLNLLGGPRYDFVKVYLPGVKHTSKYAPGWLPDWAKSGVARDGAGADAEPEPDADNGSGKPAPKGAPAAKSGPSKPPKPDAGTKDPPAETPAEPPAEKPKPKGKPKPVAAIELTGAPAFTPDDLGKALKESSEAVGEPSAALTDEAFGKLCELAEVLVFVQGADDEGQLGDRKRAARALLERVASGPGNAEKIGQLGAACLDDTARLKSGVVLAGKVGPGQPQGAWHATEIVLAKSERTVTVLSRGSLPLAEGDQAALLGSIVEEPSGNLDGYEGNKTLIVLAAAAVKLP